MRSPPAQGEGGPFPLSWTWDWGWYRHLANTGYPAGGGEEYAFFPLWPWLLRGLDWLGPSWQLAGLVSLLAALAAAVAIGRLDPARPSAARSAAAFVCFPGTSLLLMAYPDALALAAATWSLLLARRFLAGSTLLAGAVALARPNGFLIAIPHLWASEGARPGLAGQLRALPGQLRRPSAIVPSLAAIAALAAVHAFFWQRSGVRTAFTEAQELWGRTGPLALRDYFAPFVDDPSPQPALMIALAVCAIVGCCLLWRLGQAYRGWAVYAAAVVATTILSGSLQSLPRHLVFAFPLVWLLGGRPRLFSRVPVLALGAAANAALLAITYRFAP